MNNEANTTVIETTQCQLPLREIPQAQRDAKSIVVYSPNMDFCVSLQIALGAHYQVMTTTDVEMLTMLVKTFKPDLVVIRAIPSVKMRRYLMFMKRAVPKLRIIVFISARTYDLVAFNGMHNLVDGVFFEPVLITELTRTMQSLLHE